MKETVFDRAAVAPGTGDGGRKTEPKGNNMRTGILTAAAAGFLYSGLASLAERPLEMECMKPYGVDRYVIGAWVWPPKEAPVTGTPGLNRDFWTRFRDDGFTAINTTSSRAGMMRSIKGPAFDALPYEPDFIRKLGLKVMMDADHWAVWHLKDLHEKVGKHPTVLGYRMSDDNQDLYQHNIDVVWWLSQYAPKHIPWMSANPNPIAQSRSRMPVVSSQNYPWLYSEGAPEDQLRTGFCESTEADRLVANRYDMVSWVIFSCTASPSQYRFQLNAPAAYGAQAVWMFTYNPYPQAALSEAMRPANRYLVNVAGPHLLGRRCIGVLHSGPEKPSAHDGPGAGRLIEAMDEYLLAGLLVPDRSFQKGELAVDRIYIVDKRTRGFDARMKLQKEGIIAPKDALPRLTPEGEALKARMVAEDPEARAAKITLAAAVHAAYALLPDGRKLVFDLAKSRTVTLPPLRGGAAVMLAIEADPVKVIRVPGSAALVALPMAWKMELDRDKVSVAQRWEDPAFDDGKWKNGQVPAYLGWGRGFQGDGWYRLRWTIPEPLRRTHVYLHFGATDEQAWVYVDGKLVLENSMESTKMPLGRLWHIPVSTEVTASLGDGKEHLIAVRVNNAYGSGGLYEPVYLMAADEPLDADQLWRMAKQKNKEWTWLWE